MLADNDSWIRAFYGRHLPGQSPSGGVSRPSVKEYLGIDAYDAITLARCAARTMEHEFPRSAYHLFEREMLARIKTLNELSHRFETKLHRLNLVNDRAHSFVPRFFEQVASAGVSFPEQLKSFQLMQRVVPVWLKRKPFKVGSVTATPTLFTHIETPLSLVLEDEKGRLGTVGGYLYRENGKTTIRFTNIQGIGRHPRITGQKWGKSVYETKEEFAKASQEHQERYARLSKEVGVNWRVFFVRQVKQIAEARGLTIVADLPERYYNIGPIVTEEEYARQIRQAKQTFKKAGLKETNGVWIHHGTRRVLKRKML